MNLLKLTMVLLAAAFLMAGCEDDETTIFDPVPAPPQNISSITADGEIYLYFNGLYESDIDYYVIYRSLQEFTGYTEIGIVDAEPNPDGLTLFEYEFVDDDPVDGPVNGVTYFYAVSAVDLAGQESYLSAESIWDTPRPEGYQTVDFWNINPSSSGYDLSTQSVVAWDAAAADIWFDFLVINTDTTWYINVAAGDIDIMDMGFTYDFDEISFAPDVPSEFWSPLGYLEVVDGHTYLIWTADDHYAKIRIEEVDYTNRTVRFRWGYQVDQGNLQLAPKPPHGEDYLRDPQGMTLFR